MTPEIEDGGGRRAAAARDWRPVPVPQGVRVVATDLDGTLLLPDGSVGPRTRRALDDLRSTDVELVIVTGRPPRWLDDIVEMTGHRGIAIAANGALVLDLADASITALRPIDPEVGIDAVARIREVSPGATFALERAVRRHDPYGADVTEFGIGLGYSPRWLPAESPRQAPIEDLLALGGVVKLVMRPDPAYSAGVDALHGIVETALSGILEVTHSAPHGVDPRDVLLEMSAAGVSKATTLSMVVADAGHRADQVVAVGDAVNDLPMLEWAGASYAVANAHVMVRARADHLLASNAEEGVADLIEAVIARSTAHP